ncbi:MAG: amino acid permease, partial [Gemmatimonadales bacterium]
LPFGAARGAEDITAFGGWRAWLAAVSRLPFVAGIDRALPPAFARLHPKWGTPVLSLVVQAVIAAVFVVLGQAGTTVRAAYDILVSMTIICFFIPYAFMFAAMVRVQWFPAGAGVRRPPGGRPVAVALGVVGFVVVVLSILLASLPSPNESHPVQAVVKVVGVNLVLVVAGFVLYALAKRKATT